MTDNPTENWAKDLNMAFRKKRVYTEVSQSHSSTRSANGNHRSIFTDPREW